MKIIEAMKKVKENKLKITDLKVMINANCAHLSFETPLYEDAKGKVQSWAQSCEDLSKENIKLLMAIARTNLVTDATIDIGGVEVTKTLAEWIWRRREYAASDLAVYSQMSDRGLREGTQQSSTGVAVEVKIIRKYDVEVRDKKIAAYKSEPKLIDSKMEVINAVTDLIL